MSPLPPVTGIQPAGIQTPSPQVDLLGIYQLFDSVEEMHLDPHLRISILGELAGVATSVVIHLRLVGGRSEQTPDWVVPVVRAAALSIHNIGAIDWRFRHPWENEYFPFTSRVDMRVLNDLFEEVHDLSVDFDQKECGVVEAIVAEGVTDHGDLVIRIRAAPFEDAEPLYTLP